MNPLLAVFGALVVLIAIGHYVLKRLDRIIALLERKAREDS